MDAVIAGVGESPLGKTPQFTPLALQRMAAIKALDDAGLKITDVDGLISCPLRVQTWAMPSAVVAKGLGISPRYLSTMDMGGGVRCGHAGTSGHGDCEWTVRDCALCDWSKSIVLQRQRRSSAKNGRCRMGPPRL